LEQVFRFFDEDGNGTIVKEEFIAGVRKLNTHLPPGEQLSDMDAHSIMRALDLSKNQSIDINEFLEAFRIAGVDSPSNYHTQHGSWYG
jgi:Ca2+-binding EF-hand superfamily protein